MACIITTPRLPFQRFGKQCDNLRIVEMHNTIYPFTLSLACCGRLGLLSLVDLLTFASLADTCGSAEKPGSMLHLSRIRNFVLYQLLTTPDAMSYGPLYGYRKSSIATANADQHSATCFWWRIDTCDHCDQITRVNIGERINRLH